MGIKIVYVRRSIGETYKAPKGEVMEIKRSRSPASTAAAEATAAPARRVTDRPQIARVYGSHKRNLGDHPRSRARTMLALLRRGGPPASTAVRSSIRGVDLVGLGTEL